MHPTPLTLLLLPILTTISFLIPPLPQSHHPPQPPNSTLISNPTYTYHIPHTTTSLYINYFPFFPIPLPLLTRAISNIRIRMHEHIQTSGDGWLLAPNDPIIETIPAAGVDDEGWDILIQSSPVTAHLTYGVVLEVMDGWENLVNGHVIGACQIFAAIQEEGRGQVGRVRMFRVKGGGGMGGL